jgi:TRAP transporter TAXI family solute receptor
MRRSGIFEIPVILAVVLLTACSDAPMTPAPPQGSLVISTGFPGGTSNAWGLSLARQLKSTDPGLNVNVETSSGNVANLRRLTIGTADLALTTMDATEPQDADHCVTQAAAGASDERRVPLAALGRIYDDYLQIVVRSDSSVHSIADLAHRPVAVGATGSGTALVACRALSATGVTVEPHSLDVGPGLVALGSGGVDAVFWSGALPTQTITDAAAKEPLRLLPLGALADAMHTRYGAAYRAATIPPGRYGGTEQVSTVASPNLLVSRADLDPAMVETVLSTIFSRRDRLALAVPAANATDRRNAIFTGSLSLHPAAIAYYRRMNP